jgi:5-methyltetrahydropteroyltriglutamate--homocysteine methyltransferase
LFGKLSKIYHKILEELQVAGVKIVRLEEPALAFDLENTEIDDIITFYQEITKNITLSVYVQTYYESLGHYQRLVNELPVQGIGLDFSINGENYENIQKFGFPSNKILIAGIVSGRDVWKTDYQKTVSLIQELFAITGKESIVLSNSSPLFHLPVSLHQEKGYLDENLVSLLSFADERLAELTILKDIVQEEKPIPVQNLDSIRQLFKNETVQQKVSVIDEKKIGRKESFAERSSLQERILRLPLFPTTTIGSYPQTAEIRKNRATFKKGLKTKEEYQSFLKEAMKKVIQLQEQLDIDVLVHGEFERNDMVEYFGELLSGFAFTKNGWVQSYGSRYVKPPLIYSDVSRPLPMTIENIAYAQSLTDRPVKGMLTGPVTILSWSFYRRDISKKEIAYQIALALKEEVLELEKAGIHIIQIDEPAFREGLPLKKSKQREYLNWAVSAFKLTNESVRAETQIHTHMCYSEFNEILPDIYALDSDVISIETSRSKGEIIDEFEKIRYDHGIGLGVYDIHSPRIPSEEEINSIIEKSVAVIDRKLFWINPDCGLKTRDYPETISSLQHMVSAAKKLRIKYK